MSEDAAKPALYDDVVARLYDDGEALDVAALSPEELEAVEFHLAEVNALAGQDHTPPLPPPPVPVPEPGEPLDMSVEPPLPTDKTGRIIVR